MEPIEEYEQRLNHLALRAVADGQRAVSEIVTMASAKRTFRSGATIKAIAKRFSEILRGFAEDVSLAAENFASRFGIDGPTLSKLAEKAGKDLEANLIELSEVGRVGNAIGFPRIREEIRREMGQAMSDAQLKWTDIRLFAGNDMSKRVAINFNAPINGPVQIGDHNQLHQQIQNDAGNILGAVETALRQIRSEPNSNLDAREAEAELRKVKEELEKPNPAPELLRASGGSLRRIAESAAGSALGQSLTAIAGSIVALLGG